MPFCNSNDLHGKLKFSIFHVGRLSYKKASKNENFHTKIILGESMGSKLSKTVLGMSVGGLERILRHSPCWSEIVKNHEKSWFFAFFAKPLDHVLHHKFGSKRFKNIWGSVLESLWSVLSISKFFFKNLALFATRTVSSNFITKTRHFFRYTVLVTKRHQKCKKLHQQNHILKVCVLSFQNPVLECLYDLWLWFYAHLKL